MRKTIVCAAFALLIGWTVSAEATDLSGPIVLVAKPELRDAFYRATVLVVNPIGDDQHAGFIVNRSSDITLDVVFPASAPSSRIFVGGPLVPELVFALAPQETNPGGKSIKLMQGLYAVYEEVVLDELAAAQSKSARFISGFVAWRPGELKQEIDAGAWYIMPADPSVVARSPEGLWEELVQRLQKPGHYTSFSGALQ